MRSGTRRNGPISRESSAGYRRPPFDARLAQFFETCVGRRHCRRSSMTEATAGGIKPGQKGYLARGERGLLTCRPSPF